MPLQKFKLGGGQDHEQPGVHMHLRHSGPGETRGARGYTQVQECGHRRSHGHWRQYQHGPFHSPQMRHYRHK